MDKHIFVMIRYSVLTIGKDAWMIGKGQAFNDYKERLFSSSRLMLHESLFRDVTFPSLCAMDPATTTVMIFISDELPGAHKAALMKVIGTRSNFKVLEVSRHDGVIGKMNAELLRYIRNLDQDICYATVRLDDDDALADGYGEALLEYVDPAFEGHAISFSKGYNAFYENGYYHSFKQIKYPLIALGLAHVNVFKKNGKRPANVSVFSLGNHTTIDERFPVVMKADVPMFFRTIHEESDVYYKKSFKMSGESENIADVMSGFSCFRLNKLLCKPGSQAIEKERGLDVTGEKGIVTYHSTKLCYSEKENSLLHLAPSRVDKESVHLVCVESTSGQLLIADLKQYVTFSAEGWVVLSKVGGALSITPVEGGFAISPKGKELFLTPLRNGRTVLSPHCRAWEVFKAY